MREMSEAGSWKVGWYFPSEGNGGSGDAPASLAITTFISPSSDGTSSNRNGEVGLRSQDRVGSTPITPQPITPRQVQEYIRQYYGIPGNGAGGSLHITLDDGNIETGDIRYCRERAVEANDWRGILLCDMLLPMSRRQRAKAVGR